MADAKKDITKQEIKLSSYDKGKLAFILHNVYTKAECEELIKITEKKGYEAALVNVGFGRQELMTDVRNSDRCIWDSTEQTDRMWDRIKNYIPGVFKHANVVGLNERLRFLRYDGGQFFRYHYDGNYERENGEISFITVHLYLNEGFKGGNTTFLDPYTREPVAAAVPQTGSILIFQHDILHEGSELKEGRKYTVRTDVMYAFPKDA